MNWLILRRVDKFKSRYSKHIEKKTSGILKKYSYISLFFIKKGLFFIWYCNKSNLAVIFFLTEISSTHNNFKEHELYLFDESNVRTNLLPLTLMRRSGYQDRDSDIRENGRTPEREDIFPYDITFKKFPILKRIPMFDQWFGMPTDEIIGW